MKALALLSLSIAVIAAEAPHQQAQVVAHRAAEVALAQFLAAAQGRYSLPAVVEQMAKAAFEMFASRWQECFAA